MNCMCLVGWQNVNPRAAFQATLGTTQASLDTAIIINMLKDINKATHDISARLNVVETKVGAGCGGATAACYCGGASCGSATSMPTATLEQMRALLHQEGSGPCHVFSSEPAHRLCCL